MSHVGVIGDDGNSRRIEGITGIRRLILQDHMHHVTAQQCHRLFSFLWHRPERGHWLDMHPLHWRPFLQHGHFEGKMRIGGHAQQQAADRELRLARLAGGAIARHTDHMVEPAIRLQRLYAIGGCQQFQ